MATLARNQEKYGLRALTKEEKTILKDTKDDTYNVPQPYFLYLSAIGSVVDKMGKRTYLKVPALPTTVADDRSGYHANQVDLNTHCLFEEVSQVIC